MPTSNTIPDDSQENRKLARKPGSHLGPPIGLGIPNGLLINTYCLVGQCLPIGCLIVGLGNAVPLPDAHKRQANFVGEEKADLVA